MEDLWKEKKVHFEQMLQLRVFEKAMLKVCVCVCVCVRVRVRARALMYTLVLLTLKPIIFSLSLSSSPSFHLFPSTSPQVRSWLKLRAEETVSTRSDIGESMEMAQAVQEQHERFEAKTRVSEVTLRGTDRLTCFTLTEKLHCSWPCSCILP